jgi:hypothetical protein
MLVRMLVSIQKLKIFPFYLNELYQKCRAGQGTKDCVS